MNEEQLELIIDLLQREKASTQDNDEKMKTIDATLKSIFQYMLTHGGEE